MTQKPTTIESSIHPDHDIEVTEHGLGLDIAQNGLVVHIDHSQFDRLCEILEEAQ